MKNAANRIYTEITFEEAFEGYFSQNIKWNYFKTEYEDVIVEFEGKSPIDDEEVFVQFEVLNDEIEVVYMELSGVALTVEETNAVLSYIFSYISES